MPDLRKFARQTESRLVIGLFVLLFTVGLVLVYIFYGINAALTGLLCLAGLLIPVLVILLVLSLIERFTNNDRKF